MSGPTYISPVAPDALGKPIKYSEVLRLARPLIESGDCDFVCHAIEAVTDEQHPLMFVISARIAPCVTVCSWLEDAAKISVREAYHTDLIRAYRLRWIDSMIEEFSAQDN